MSQHSHLTYELEPWSMKVTNEQKVNEFEMNCLRSMVDVTRKGDRELSNSSENEYEDR